MKENGKELIVGTVIAPRPLAEEGANRANRLATVFAERAGRPAALADIEAMLAWDAEWTAAERAAEGEAWDEDWVEEPGTAGDMADR